MDRAGLRAAILAEIGAERAHQEERWADPGRDMRYTTGGWAALSMECQARALAAAGAGASTEYRRRLVRVAALTVAATRADAERGGGRGSRAASGPGGT